jgi:hypothetical protein
LEYVLKKFLNYIKFKLPFLEILFSLGLIVLVCALAIIFIRCVRHSNSNPIDSSYQVFCIENIKYVSVNGMLTAKYTVTGEIETCDLDEM